jgi:hypothetical protein
MTTSIITLLLCVFTTTTKQLLPWKNNSTSSTNQSMNEECEIVWQSCPWRQVKEIVCETILQNFVKGLYQAKIEQIGKP